MQNTPRLIFILFVLGFVLFGLGACEKKALSPTTPNGKSNTNAQTKMKPTTNTTITFKIKGMTCSGCVNSIRQALLATPGVSKAHVTLTPPQAVVTYASGTTNPSVLLAAIQKGGYRSALPGQPIPAPRPPNAATPSPTTPSKRKNAP